MQMGATEVRLLIDICLFVVLYVGGTFKKKLNVLLCQLYVVVLLAAIIFRNGCCPQRFVTLIWSFTEF